MIGRKKSVSRIKSGGRRKEAAPKEPTIKFPTPEEREKIEDRMGEADRNARQKASEQLTSFQKTLLSKQLYGGWTTDKSKKAKKMYYTIDGKQVPVRLQDRADILAYAITRDWISFHSPPYRDMPTKNAHFKAAIVEESKDGKRATIKFTLIGAQPPEDFYKGGHLGYPRVAREEMIHILNSYTTTTMYLTRGGEIRTPTDVFINRGFGKNAQGQLEVTAIVKNKWA